MNKKCRPTIATQNVGHQRQLNYQNVISQYHLAMANGFYIEAISLMESIIGDRLESLANEISASSNYSYCTLEKLLSYLCGTKQKNQISLEIQSVFDDICCWKDQRNKACHEMAKEISTSFYERYDSLEEVAEDGYDIFRQLDKVIRDFRKNNKL